MGRLKIQAPPSCPCCCPKVQTDCCPNPISCCIVGRIESTTGCYQGDRFSMECYAPEVGPVVWTSPHLFTADDGCGGAFFLYFGLVCTVDGFQATMTVAFGTGGQIAYPDEMSCGPPFTARFTFSDPVNEDCCPGGLTLIVEEAAVECDCCCCMPTCTLGTRLMEIEPFIIGDGGECAIGTWVNNAFPPAGLGNRFIIASGEDQTTDEDCITYYTGESGRYDVYFDVDGNPTVPEIECLKDASCIESDLFGYTYGTHYALRTMPSETPGMCTLLLRLMLVRKCQDEPFTAVEVDSVVAGEWQLEMTSEFCHNHAHDSPLTLDLMRNIADDPGYFVLPSTVTIIITCTDDEEGGGDEDPPGDGDGIG